MVNLKLEDVTKIYDGGHLAVDSINLEIEHGEFFTFVGPSGCGKTTTLRMVAGLESVTEGTIYFDDEDVTDYPPQQRDIAMVFQDVVLYPNMTVHENIGYGLRIRDEMDGYDEMIEETAELLEITDQLDKMPADLSGGQQQRVALGRAIVRDPNLILFDEPMSDLDAKLKSELRVKVQQLHRRLDTTMVYVTHDQEEALTMSDRIGVMNNGKLVQAGTPEEIFNEPKNKFISTFIGQPSMNILDAAVNPNGTVTVAGNTDVPLSIDPDAITGGIDDRTFEIGFRPRHATFVDSSEDAIVTATIDVWEPIGTNYIVHLHTDTDMPITVVSTDIPAQQEGETVTIGNFSMWYLFDSDTGEMVYRNTEETITAETV